MEIIKARIVEPGDEEQRIPNLNERATDELVVAMVGPIGSGCTFSAEIIEEILVDEFDYQVVYKRLSEFIVEALEGNKNHSNLSNKLPEDRVGLLQDYGDKLRKDYGKSVLAAKAIEYIFSEREKDGLDYSKNGSLLPKKLRRAYILDSLKNPEELKILKKTYGDMLWVIGVFAPIEERVERLVSFESFEEKRAQNLINKDYNDNDLDYGQNVRDVFSDADLFIRNSSMDRDDLKRVISRFVNIIFNVGVHTPTLDESSMFAAYAEAVKSACLSRQVGAAIVNSNGEIISVGRNDVPAGGGGLYSENHENDRRCYKHGGLCYNDASKSKLFETIFNQLSGNGLLNESATKKEVLDVVRETDIKSLIEYSRAVHAEMDAIISVARAQKPGLVGATLYSTTFPCHSCARHIVASGITKVYFIEPYPKSLALNLHKDSVTDRAIEEKSDLKVSFLQYNGIAPKNVYRLFYHEGIRKSKSDGKFVSQNKKHASPKVSVSIYDYVTHEQLVIAELKENEEKAKIKQANLPGV